MAWIHILHLPWGKIWGGVEFTLDVRGWTVLPKIKMADFRQVKQSSNLKLPISTKVTKSML